MAKHIYRRYTLFQLLYINALYRKNKMSIYDISKKFGRTKYGIKYAIRKSKLILVNK